jgi:hypothetical protein
MFKRKKNVKNRKDIMDQVLPDFQAIDAPPTRDSLSAFLWGAVVLWAGMVFLATNLGMLDSVLPVTLKVLPGVPGYFHPEVWSVILVGAGLLIWLGVIIRILVPAFRHDIISGLVFGLILMGIGFGILYGWDLAWPVLLVGIGLSVLLRAVFRH